MDFSRLPFARSWEGSGLHRNVGREDRLVRGCVALSIALIGGFVLGVSGHAGVFSIALAVLLGFFILTGVFGWDPLYAWGGLDTRTDAELGVIPAWDEYADQLVYVQADEQPEEHRIVDLTDSARAGSGGVHLPG